MIVTDISIIGEFHPAKSLSAAQSEKLSEPVLMQRIGDGEKNARSEPCRPHRRQNHTPRVAGVII